ncbi:MAG: hypothetical protein RIQ89_1295 [Bacteroidota bacterium]|jgi:hypothetical protein
MKGIIKSIKSIFIDQSVNSKLFELEYNIEKSKLLIGKSLTNQVIEKADQCVANIHCAEFSVFSQWGDDGIIQFLTYYLGLKNGTFMEFGVENYTESNTRFLLMNNNWKGLVIDGSETNIHQIKNSYYFWKYDLTALTHFVTCENINRIITENGFANDIDLLHIDIDGNDYWIWESINTIDPTIVIVEYNSVFGIENPASIPYEPNFQRKVAHYSNLYFGCSISALIHLAATKGYIFIGTNSNGNNAYFVKESKAKNLKQISAQEGAVMARFRESRNQSGELTYLDQKAGLACIKGLPIQNVVDQSISKL